MPSGPWHWSWQAFQNRHRGVAYEKVFFITPTLRLLQISASALETAQAAFVVQFYDVDSEVLQGKRGFLGVERCQPGAMEDDLVSSDSQLGCQAQMENWLKEAGTYEKTVDKLPRGEKR